LQEIQEQVWHQAALDLRLNKQQEPTLRSPVSIVQSELPKLNSSDPSVMPPLAALQASLPANSTIAGI